MFRNVLSSILLVVFAAGCAGGGVDHAATVMPRAAASLAPSATGFKIPAAISRPAPPQPPKFTPKQPSTDRRASTVTPGTHPPFFAGEASLGSGAYYLAFPNGNVFGYYSYLSDPNYIYHFDMGYEYIVDANDGQGGIYFYDFTTQHWWYTGRNYPFPYVYDFSLGSVLYYYPSASSVEHYTTNPRVFYDFATGSVITPDQNPALSFQPANAIRIYQASSYTNGGANCTNGPNTYCVGPGDVYGQGFHADILPQQSGHQGPWGLQTTSAATAQAYNCQNGFANGVTCVYGNSGISVFGVAPGAATVTVSGDSNVSNPIYVDVSETSVVVNLQNMTDAVKMTITTNDDNSSGIKPVQDVTFGRTLGPSEVYTVKNFPIVDATKSISVTVTNGSSPIAAATVTGISIDPLHANTITVTPQRL